MVGVQQGLHVMLACLSQVLPDQHIDDEVAPGTGNPIATWFGPATGSVVVVLVSRDLLPLCP